MATKRWVLDPAHSELQFKIKHLMVSNVTGSFTDFKAEATSNTEDFQDAAIVATISVDSISTRSADRDEHLLSKDFFDSENHPEIKFVSTGFNKTNEEDVYELSGGLTIKGETRPIKLKAEYGGIAKDPWGNIKTAFSLQGKINRADWGLNYNAALETGGVLLSEEVRILAEIQMAEAVEQEVTA